MYVHSGQINIDSVVSKHMHCNFWCSPMAQQVGPGDMARTRHLVALVETQLTLIVKSQP